ncbi:HNH endonuclease signature motif containing protein [Actinobacillus equuli]|uniref:HNH endonuclease signature motif containing protein n=1 Tax=Actinobacillus equuli TaxID=718 RepID=UPI002441CF5C|nr:HNH endonuclease signature motif containing protein [Actinobacillus equuli]WGE75422.1 HNH endonuclease [Actinobacillus equuli subsp. haemolyticus]
MNRATYIQPRPRIPSDLQRKVKIEAGHKCAVNRCNSTTCEIHHIDGNRENNVIENLIFLCRNHHKQAHEGFITKKELMEYKLTASFLDREDLALEFYQKHVLELDKVLKLKLWIDISDNLLAWRLHNKVMLAFIDGIYIIKNTRYPEEYPDLRNAIENISNVLSNLVSHFTDHENIVFIEGKLNCSDV